MFLDPLKTWRWTLWALFAIALMMVAVLSNRPASAQAACGPLPQMLSRLVERFHEFVVFTGNTEQGQIMVTKNDDGDFTIIQTNGEVGCILAVGKGAAFNNGI